MKKRNNFTRFLMLLRRANLLPRKTHPKHYLRLRVVTMEGVSSRDVPNSGVNNADRRRNFTNFNKPLMDRVIEANSIKL